MKKRLIAGLIAGLCTVHSMFCLSVSAVQDTKLNGGSAVTGQTSEIGYATELYNADNGLPTSEANVVFSSSDGFVWIGGYSGLLRCDGNSFERQDSSTGITSVNTLFEDSHGRLWIGTNDNGIVYLYKGESQHYSYAEGLNSASVNRPCQCH